MPANYRIDHEDRIVFSRGWGALTDWELTRHQEALRLDPVFDPTYAQLWDLRELSHEATVSVAAVRALAGRDIFAPWARRAFVTPNPLSFKLARIFALLRRERGENGIEVFRNFHTAQAWIGIG